MHGTSSRRAPPYSSRKATPPPHPPNIHTPVVYNSIKVDPKADSARHFLPSCRDTKSAQAMYHGRVQRTPAPPRLPPHMHAHMRHPLNQSSLIHVTPCSTALAGQAQVPRPSSGRGIRRSNPPPRQGCARSRPRLRRRMLGSKDGSAFEEDWGARRLIPVARPTIRPSKKGLV